MKYILTFEQVQDYCGWGIMEDECDYPEGDYCSEKTCGKLKEYEWVDENGREI